MNEYYKEFQGMIRKTYWLVIVLFLLSGCFDATGNNSPKNKTALLKPCPGFEETGTPPLVYGAECGELSVLENPEDTHSRTIALNILRLPAINPVPKRDPLFLIQGGPGGSSVEMAKQVHLFFNDVRKNRDLIFVDQRGTGKSSPMDCETLTESELQLSEVEQEQKYAALMHQCADKYRAQVQFYTTPYAVTDLEAVRKALDYETINLWGGSYGTRVVLEYMRTYPDKLRTVIMDGVAPVQIGLPKYFQSDAWNALSAVNQECEQQSECVRLYGNMLVNAELVSQRLLDAQQQGEPLVVTYEHPRYQQQTELVFTPKSFSMLVFMSLYSRDLTSLLPRALAEAAQGKFRLLAALHALASEQSSFNGISEGMRYSVICNEDNHYISAQDIVESKSFLGMNMLKDIARVCDFWPRAVMPEQYFSPVSSQLPALLLSGGHDPVTPERWAQQVAQHLPSAHLLSAAGGNHIVSMEGCVPQIIAQFIEQGTMGATKTDCVKNIKSLPLVRGANTKSLVALTINSASSNSSLSSSRHSLAGSEQQ